MLVWLDLETTGLDANTEHVLEVAAIVTDDALNEVARFERVIYSPIADRVLAHEADFTRRRRELDEVGETDDRIILEAYRFHNTGRRDLDPYVVRMHLDNGLWRASRLGQALATVDADLAKFIREHAVTVDDKGKKVMPQLAGSTISFDRAFLEARLPHAAKTLHYRNLDVSTMNEVARRFWTPTFEGRPRAPKATHRGMADIEISLATLRYYLGVVAIVEKREAA